MKPSSLSSMFTSHRSLAVTHALLVTGASLFMALLIRFDGVVAGHVSFGTFVVPLTILVLCRLIAYRYYSINAVRWRYTSTYEVPRITKAHLLSSLLLLGFSFFLRTHQLPRSVIIGECAISVMVAAALRLSVRLYAEWDNGGRAKDPELLREIVVIGGGTSGHLFVKTVLSQPRLAYRPVAILDDEAKLHGTNLAGVPITGSISDLRRTLIERPRVCAVVVAIPSLSTLKLQELQAVCDSLHLPLKQLQTFEEIACRDGLEPKTKLSVEEVLNRGVALTKEPEVLKQIEGKVVLITGAGGSIGSELVRQVVSYGPSKVILVDQSEYNLYAIEQEMRHLAAKVQKVFFLANIVNMKRLSQAFLRHRPQLVFHAAAYKHVPLLEANCYEAFLNNVIGSRNLIECAKTYGVERFVLISSDKAVDPSSVMGATKRIKELMVGQANSHYSHKTGTLPVTRRNMNTSVVRFGNVINSSGSVIPLFKRQILEGKPLTVTHPRMDRYFMSIREAVRLVLSAGTLADQGEIYLLDMGKPIKIVDVAKKLLALYGRRDLPIVFTGLREGEKLSEVLYSTTETQSTTEFDKVFVVRPVSEITADVYGWVKQIEERLDSMSDAEISTAIHNFIKRMNGTLDADFDDMTLVGAGKSKLTGLSAAN